jgi:polysaccharide biosynthesis transport protein
MNFSLVYFVRLFSKHLFLIVMVPLILAASVFVFTKDEPQTFISKTTVFTSLASGNSVDLTGFTFNTVNTQFDNLMGIIKSNATLEKTGLSLFAGHLMLEKPNPMIIQPEHHEELMKTVPAEVKKLIVRNDFEKTLENLKQFSESSNNNFVYNLIHKKDCYYNPSTILGKLTVRRIQNSDNIELSYESDDPGVCQQTLIYLVKVYKQAYIIQKAGQSDNAVAYFESEVAKASDQLQAAENELLEYNEANKIINYNEQSKFIAGRKEQFEMGYQEVLRQNAAAKAVIDLMDKKMTPGIRRRLTGSELINLRKELGKVNEDLASMQLPGDEENDRTANQGKFKSLTQKSFQLKEKMHNVVDSLYELTNGNTNVPERNIVTDWLSSTIDFESTSAQIVTMDKLRQEFDVIYSQ